jgi:hypothetical protein
MFSPRETDSPRSEQSPPQGSAVTPTEAQVSQPSSFADEVAELRGRTDRILRRIDGLRASPEDGGARPAAGDPDPGGGPAAAAGAKLLPTKHRLALRHAHLAADIERLNRANRCLSSHIRDLQLKIREARVEEERMNQAIAVAQGRKTIVPGVT